jgi:predicted nucleic acid-binding protein
VTSSTTTGTAEPILVDTNVLLEATDERRQHHADAVALLESTEDLVLSAQVIREYLAVATRSITANGLGLSMMDALVNMAEFRRSIRLLPEERPILPTFLALLAQAPCTGKRVHDAHIVATAVVHRVRSIVSLNRDDLAAFTTTIAIVSPAEALQARPTAARRRRRSRRPGGA